MNQKSDLLAELRIDRPDENEQAASRWPWIIAGVIAAGLAAVGYFQFQGPRALVIQSERAESMPTTQVASVLDASGYVTARRLATVSSKVTGKVAEVRIEEGMRVEEGQILALLDDSSVRVDYELSVARQEAAQTQLEEIRVLLEEARRSLRRTEELRSRDLASEADLDAAQADVDTMEARLAARSRDVVVAERAMAVQQQRLDDTVIRAPFAGVVIAKAAQPGEMISPISAGGGFTRTGIGTLVDMDSLEIEVDVNEAYIQRVSPGQRVSATLDAYPDWSIPASVIAIIPTADRQKATVRVRIGFDQLDSRILPDMGVRVAFHSGEPPSSTDRQPGVLIAPAAIRQESDAEVVFLIRDGRAHRRAIRTEGRFSGRAVVIAGLSAGDVIVSPLPTELNDGDPITIGTEEGETR